MATILVIEDDSTILENTLELLELEGFDVIGAIDGAEGLAEALEHRPDVIICDVRMPKLDGYDVLREVRRNPATATIPFIFVSATPREEIQAASAKLGVSEFLLKPFRADDLLRMVRNHVGRRAAQ